MYYGEPTGTEIATNLSQQLHKCLTIRSNQRYNDAVLFTDSQVAIPALRRPDRRPSGQAAPRRVIEMLHEMPMTLRPRDNMLDPIACRGRWP